ncbi:DNA replication origin binding protein [Rhodotorula toruloides ATCC 204091]|uniref:Origin recognition complex subunit 2 n=1 Tax=Rhodotorula toruloides TaxID=5286 RepID=A0A0K3CHM9_RHOTO|nr:DNA replication origin binding protein [Rhodotorula toruloides ATCC 204091]KAK4332466.1 DNA replication origin binding protein [Rhodotorula toruloides]PRQ72775.1 DNA replication origin binding protein [Rhodotorula toruloides]
MPPRKARAASTPKKTPSKPSAKAKGKRKATDAPSPSPAQRRSRNTAPTGDSDGSDGEDAYRDDDAPATFVTASAGDAYMLYSTQTSKTTDALLSTSIDPAFTTASYQAALRKFDAAQSAGFEALREASQARVQRAKERFSRWMWEMEQGFNILLGGVGSKRTVLNAFAEKARTRGNVVVINGFDTAATLVDLVTALEDLIRTQGGQDAGEEEDEEMASPRKRRRTAAPAKAKGKGKASTAYSTARPVSALESRVRRLCASIQAAAKVQPAFKPIFLVIHSLDGPSLRLPKNISLLALLAAQSHIHLVASVDHVRASLMFPTALVAARPPTASSAETSAEAADLSLSFRAFTFLHYDVSTLLPYDVEVASLGTLSHLLPPSTYPPLSSSLDPTASSLAQSATHVLASVTDRAKRLFNLLGQEQVKMAESLPREVERAMRLTGGAAAGREAEKAPVVAMSLASLKEKATDELIATHPDQVDGFLSEFKDHGVVRSSNQAPEIIEGVNDDEDEQAEEGGEWVWIPLAKEALEEVLEELGVEE